MFRCLFLIFIYFSFCCCLFYFFFFSSRRRHTRSYGDWSSDVCSSDLNRFLNVRLVGTKSNRSAIGARVIVTAGGRKLVNEVRSGSTFMSQSDLRLHFGLGQAQAVDRVEIEWPSGAKETVTGVKTSSFISVVEGKGLSR